MTDLIQALNNADTQTVNALVAISLVGMLIICGTFLGFVHILTRNRNGKSSD
jgi:hypothetical protein